MAIVKVADRGVRNSTGTGTATVTLTNPTLITPGNYLIARVAVDNSGSAGARPGLAITDSRGHTWIDPAGALQDPGAASAGCACYLAYVRVDIAYQAGDTVVFTWTNGTPISAIVIEEWSGIRSSTPEAVAQTTANNVSTTAQPAISRTPTAAGQLMYVACAAEQQGTEWGAQDSDTTNGSWIDLTKDAANTGTHDTSMAVYGGAKVVTASGAQTWNNTLSVTGDWAACAIVFAAEADVPEFAARRIFRIVGEEDYPDYFQKARKLNPAIFYLGPAASGAVTASVAVVATAAGGQPPTDIIPGAAHYVQGERPDYFQKLRRFNPALAPVAAAVGGVVAAQFSVVATVAGSQQSGVLASPRWTVVDGDPPEYLRRPRPINPALYAITAAASGVVSARVVVVATAVESRQATGIVSARVAVVTTAAGSRQTGGVVAATSTVVAKTTGAQGAVVGGAVSARVTVVATAAGNRQATGGSTARAAVITTATETRQTGGQTVAAATVVARPTGAQGNVIGGKVTATVTVVARTAGSRGATGASSAQATVVATPTEKRATTGGSLTVGTVIARTTGTQGAVVGGRVNATAVVIVLASEKRAVTAAAVSARFAAVATAIGKRATSGAARAVGVVVATPASSITALGGDAAQSFMQIGRAAQTIRKQAAGMTMTQGADGRIQP